MLAFVDPKEGNNSNNTEKANYISRLALLLCEPMSDTHKKENCIRPLLPIYITQIIGGESQDPFYLMTRQR